MHIVGHLNAPMSTRSTLSPAHGRALWAVPQGIGQKVVGYNFEPQGVRGDAGTLQALGVQAVTELRQTLSHVGQDIGHVQRRQNGDAFAGDVLQGQGLNDNGLDILHRLARLLQHALCFVMGAHHHRNHRQGIFDFVGHLLGHFAPRALTLADILIVAINPLMREVLPRTP